jgi:DNA-binding MarR family transcriptional regulator
VIVLIALILAKATFAAAHCGVCRQRLHKNAVNFAKAPQIVDRGMVFWREAMSDSRLAVVHDIERLIHEITWRDRRQFARLVSEFRLSALQYLALHEIGRLGPDITMGHVGEVVQVPPSSMTNIVDRLVTAGLVSRGATPTDRRAVVVNLTNVGADLIAKVESVREEILHNALKNQPDRDLTELARILGDLLIGMDGHATDA